MELEVITWNNLAWEDKYSVISHVGSNQVRFLEAKGKRRCDCQRLERVARRKDFQCFQPKIDHFRAGYIYCDLTITRYMHILDEASGTS